MANLPACGRIENHAAHEYTDILGERRPCGGLELPARRPVPPADPAPRSPEGTADETTAALERWKQATEAATPAPWGDEDSDDCWRLFGALTTGRHPLQLIKAPKRGTPYAEYWPTPADAEFIVTARTAMPRLVAAVERILELAGGAAVTLSACGVSGRCSCGEHPVAWNFDPAEVREAITRELTGQEDGSA